MTKSIEFTGAFLPEIDDAMRRNVRVVDVPGLVYNGGNHYAAELLLREIEAALA